MVRGLRRELKSVGLLLALAIVSVLLVFLMTGPEMAGSGGLFESPTSPLRISPIPSPPEQEVVGRSTPPPLIAVHVQPNYVPWILGGLVIIGGVVGVMLYRRGRIGEG